MPRLDLDPIAAPATVLGYTAAQDARAILSKVRAGLDQTAGSGDAVAIFGTADSSVEAGTLVRVDFAPPGCRYLLTLTGLEAESRLKSIPDEEMCPFVVIVRLAGTEALNVLLSGDPKGAIAPFGTVDKIPDELAKHGPGGELRLNDSSMYAPGESTDQLFDDNFAGLILDATGVATANDNQGRPMAVVQRHGGYDPDADANVVVTWRLTPAMGGSGPAYFFLCQIGTGEDEDRRTPAALSRTGDLTLAGSLQTAGPVLADGNVDAGGDVNVDGDVLAGGVIRPGQVTPIVAGAGGRDSNGFWQIFAGGLLRALAVAGQVGNANQTKLANYQLLPGDFVAFDTQAGVLVAMLPSIASLVGATACGVVITAGFNNLTVARKSGTNDKINIDQVEGVSDTVLPSDRLVIYVAFGGAWYRK